MSTYLRKILALCLAFTMVAGTSVFATEDATVYEEDENGYYVDADGAYLVDEGDYLIAPDGSPIVDDEGNPVHIDDVVIDVVIEDVDDAEEVTDDAEEVDETPVIEEPQVLRVVANPASVLVDGKAVAFEAYNINDNNYFKLRDIAMVLNGTETQFNVTWNAETQTIELVDNAPYTPAGGELEASDSAENPVVVPSTATVCFAGAEEALELTAYNINGNNYFKLRDLAEALAFGVDWDAEKNSVIIDSTLQLDDADDAEDVVDAEEVD